MKMITYLKLAVMVIAASLVVCACGSSKQAASTTPKAGFVKQVKDECEEMALKDPKKASGSAESQSERLAKNAAALDARTNLITSVQTILVGMIKNFDKEHQAGAGQGKQSDFISMSGQEQKGLVDGVISSSIVCSNAYYNEQTNTYKVYACAEMSDGSIGQLYNKLSQDKKIAIQFEEKKFREEMEKELENYRSRQQ